MPHGNPARKLAITVDAEVAEGVSRAARQESVSVSAWMTAAARRALRIRDGLAAVAEWEAQHGALTQREIEEAFARVRQKHAGPPPPRRARAR